MSASPDLLIHRIVRGALWVFLLPIYYQRQEKRKNIKIQKILLILSNNLIFEVYRKRQTKGRAFVFSAHNFNIPTQASCHDAGAGQAETMAITRCYCAFINLSVASENRLMMLRWNTGTVINNIYDKPISR